MSYFPDMKGRRKNQICKLLINVIRKSPVLKEILCVKGKESVISKDFVTKISKIRVSDCYLASHLRAFPWLKFNIFLHSCIPDNLF